MTIQDFRADYSKELFEHYLVLPDFNTAQEYITECCGEGSNIIDFAGTYGANTAKELTKFYDKNYHKTIQISPILVEVDDDNKTKEILLTIEEPTFIATHIGYQGESFLAILNTLMFSINKPKPGLNRYVRALESAKLLRSVFFGEIPTGEFKRQIDELNPGYEYGDSIEQNTIIGGIMLAENSNDNRFEDLYDNGPHSYWHEISFTDFQDDDETDPSKSERLLIETQIEDIYNEIQAEISSNEAEYDSSWDDALEWARKIEAVWTNELSVREFIDILASPDQPYKIAHHVREDPDRPGNLIVNGDRFSSILRGSNSLWDYLTNTDFNLGPEAVIPSEDRIEWNCNEIQRIGIRLCSF